MDDWQKARAKWVQIGGLRCNCCNNGLPKRRNNKNGKHRFSQMIRSRLKARVRKEMTEYCRTEQIRQSLVELAEVLKEESGDD